MLDLTEEFEFQSTLPVWGATWRALREYRLHRHFNPRSPCGERLRHIPQAGGCTAFQSTLPVWGATLVQIQRVIPFLYFNPRSPCGERRDGLGALTPKGGISIHAPRVGSDPNVVDTLKLKSGISIHAPRVGSDVRLVHQKEEDKISIHAPRVGSDGKILASYHIITSYFNPRSPCGERRLFRPMRIPACRRISIHAPRVGSDCRRAYAELGGVKFQSTLPVWGATFNSKIPP